MSLLQKAKDRKPIARFKKTFSKEEIELAFGYVKGEVGLMQVSVALGYKGHQHVMVYAFIARALRQHYSK